jgi:glycosyltransferase involved in cell wall biosynthesis
MGDIRLSIVVPTCGRATLKNTILSILPQMHAGDELIVVHDGPGEFWPDVVLTEIRDGATLSFARTGEKTANNGASQRDKGMELAKGTHLMFCDDDDIFTPDALAAARERIERTPENMLIFRMQYGLDDHKLWTVPLYELCNVGTPMFVVPNLRLLPSWTGWQANIHDFLWGKAVQEETGLKAIFIDKVISIIRPRKDQLPGA